MKKINKVLIGLLALSSAVCASFALTACNDGSQEHEHGFGEWTDLVNTCTEHIQERKCSECELKEIKTLQAAGHVYGDWTDEIDTCDKHVQSRTCEKCGIGEVNELKTSGHKFGLWTNIVDTCTERVVRRECTECGKIEIDDSLIPKGHNFDDWSDFVNSCTDHLQIRVCQNEGCARKEYQYLITSGHSYGDWEDLISTCTEHIQVRNCTKCGVQETQELSPIDHTFVSDRCIYCGTLGYNGVSLDYLDAYNSTYGLNYFANNELYAEYAFYKRIDEQARIFHANTNLDAKYQSIDGVPSYVVSKIEFADLGLTVERAVSVWKTYKDDNPLYYWIDNSTAIEEKKRICFLSSSDYAQGSVRETANELVYQKVTEYLSLLSKDDNKYTTALAFHDAIINAIDYAYQSDGTTPSAEAWAHNILGLFEGKGGTCETYSRAYQLLLNSAGVENVFVTGTAGGGGHSWNLVRLDDRHWYWCDLTWDDTPAFSCGISYNYFIVNDTQNIGSGTRTFLDSHTYQTPLNTQVEFLYALPDRPLVPYSNATPVLYKTFNTTNAVYAVSGYNTVQLINSLASGAFDIPETVIYSGKTYTVTSIGAFKNGEFDEGYVLKDSETSITIPKTVKYIWDYALVGSSLQSITVATENEYYKSVDGVLFTKSGEYLVQYPANKSNTQYTIPDGCIEVVYNAFSSVKNLNILNIGKDVEGFGLAGWGYRYEYSTNYIAGCLANISSDLTAGGKITVHSENTSYIADDNAVYDIDSKYNLLRLECVFDKNMTSFTLGKTVFRLNYGVFDDCNELESITVENGNEYLSSVGGIVYENDTKNILIVPNALKGDVVIPDTVTAIGSLQSNSSRTTFYYKRSVTSVSFGKNITVIGKNAFSYCTSLTTINFNGTLNEWKAIEKADVWCANTGNFRVVCTNGSCDKNGNVVA